MAMGSELKPCPFCGAAPKIEVLGGAGSSYRTIRCSQCKCDMHFWPTEEMAIAEWNRRLRAELNQEGRE